MTILFFNKAVHSQIFFVCDEKWSHRLIICKNLKQVFFLSNTHRKSGMQKIHKQGIVCLLSHIKAGKKFFEFFFIYWMEIFILPFENKFLFSLLSIHTHTYIHNWPLQPFSHDYGLASHTTHVVCFNFIREWREEVTV